MVRYYKWFIESRGGVFLIFSLIRSVDEIAYGRLQKIISRQLVFFLYELLSFLYTTR
jgi:hypothetical protein